MNEMPDPSDARSRGKFRPLLFILFFAIASAASLAAPDLPKEIASRLAAKWLADARQIHTPEHVIYYHGSASGGTARDGKHWAGEIKGEILMLSPTMAIACPKVLLGPTGSISIEGTHQIQIADGAPPWKKLLERRK